MRLLIALSLAAGLAGCGFIYKQDIQQGNVLKQEQVDMLAPGMTRRQVAVVLGTPAVSDPFHRDRWDYVSVFKPGGEKLEKRRQLTLYFEGNELVRIEGDMKPTGAELLSEDDIAETIEEVKEDRDPQALEQQRAPRSPEPTGRDNN